MIFEQCFILVKAVLHVLFHIWKTLWSTHHFRVNVKITNIVIILGFRFIILEFIVK